MRCQPLRRSSCRRVSTCFSRTKICSTCDSLGALILSRTLFVGLGTEFLWMFLASCNRLPDAERQAAGMHSRLCSFLCFIFRNATKARFGLLDHYFKKCCVLYAWHRFNWCLYTAVRISQTSETVRFKCSSYSQGAGQLKDLGMSWFFICHLSGHKNVMNNLTKPTTKSTKTVS